MQPLPQLLAGRGFTPHRQKLRTKPRFLNPTAVIDGVNCCGAGRSKQLVAKRRKRKRKQLQLDRAQRKRAQLKEVELVRVMEQTSRTREEAGESFFDGDRLMMDVQ